MLDKTCGIELNASFHCDNEKFANFVDALLLWIWNFAAVRMSPNRDNENMFRGLTASVIADTKEKLFRSCSSAGQQRNICRISRHTLSMLPLSSLQCHDPANIESDAWARCDSYPIIISQFSLNKICKQKYFRAGSSGKKKNQLNNWVATYTRRVCLFALQTVREILENMSSSGKRIQIYRIFW